MPYSQIERLPPSKRLATSSSRWHSRTSSIPILTRSRASSSVGALAAFSATAIFPKSLRGPVDRVHGRCQCARSAAAWRRASFQTPDIANLNQFDFGNCRFSAHRAQVNKIRFSPTRPYSMSSVRRRIGLLLRAPRQGPLNSGCTFLMRSCGHQLSSAPWRGGATP